MNQVLSNRGLRIGLLLIAATAVALLTVFAAIGSSSKANADPVTPSVTYAVPKIGGTTQVGHTLTVAAGAWGPAGVTLTYQWVVGGVDVYGATSTTYTVQAGDYGHAVSVRVTGELAGYTPVTVTSALTRAITAAPFVKGHPVISGSAHVGGTLTVDPGTWSPTPSSFSYQWYLRGKAISHATNASYTVTASALHRALTVKVTARAAGYTTTSVLASIHTIGYGILSTATPLVNGVAQVGKSLTASHTSWASSVSYSYQWYVNGRPVSHATKSSFGIPSSALGLPISVRVGGSKHYYATAHVYSAPTGLTVLGDITAPTTIGGSPVAGQTLSAVTTGWTSSVTKTYQWYENGTLVPAATASTFRLTSADAGSTLTVSVNGTKAAYNPVTASSDSTGPVVLPFDAAPTPQITGTLTQGQTLSAVPGTWSPVPATLTYQWYANGHAIDGATSNTYQLAATDAGTHITVKVTASTDGYATTSRISAKTSAIKAIATVPWIHEGATQAFQELDTFRANNGLPPFVENVVALDCVFRWTVGGASTSQTPAQLIIDGHSNIVLTNYPSPEWTAATWTEGTDANGLYEGTLKVYECSN